jgi:hypothetical protein
MEKEHTIGILFLEGKKVWFKELPSSVIIIRYPNWSTNIIWYETGYIKGKILSPIKHPT